VERCTAGFHQIIVFDAPRPGAESAFWSAMLGGRVEPEDDWHMIYDAENKPRMGIQLAPDHIRPEWPDGTPQQIHLDLYVKDIRAAHDEATSLGATLLKAADDLDARNGFQVYADPAGHPFCLCWI
jgi:predicted enzyme related to lactoylglutathione lyase